MTTYRINRKTEEPVSITCLICERTSYSASDVHELFCGNCHIFHENPFERRLLWPEDSDHVVISRKEYNRTINIVMVVGLFLTIVILRLTILKGV